MGVDPYIFLLVRGGVREHYQREHGVTMLVQTRRAVEALKEAGLVRAQFRIRTPWKQSTSGISFGETTIRLLCSYAQTAPYIQKLAKSFKVVVTIFDGVACHVSIEIAEEPGLYKFEHGKVEAVREIVLNSNYEQLPLWNDTLAPRS
jgi:hypothetical protein